MAKESSKAVAAYAKYEEMGEDRSLARLAELLYGKSTVNIRQLERWSAQHGWVARTHVYDAAKMHRERIEQEKRDRERTRRREARERQREEDRERMDDERAILMRNTWMQTLKDIQDRLKQSETKGMVGLVALLKHTMDEERLSRGGVTTINEQRVTGKDGESLMTPVGQAIAAALLARMGSNPQARDVIASALLEEASDDSELYPR